MLLRTLALCAALLVSTQAEARVHRGRPRENKIFAANHDSVRLENEAADAFGAPRYLTQEDVNKAVSNYELVELYNQKAYVICRKLPENRRYALPSTAAFLESFGEEFYAQFHQPLMVDSAVRPATLQKKLSRWNHSAAPAYGDYPSSHERGTTFDLSKHMTKAQHRWMTLRLLYYRAIGRVLVIQERHCWHIFVRGDSVLNDHSRDHREPTQPYEAGLLRPQHVRVLSDFFEGGRRP